MKIVTNLPYNITTDFLKQTLPLGDFISDIYVMVQDEAAARLTARTPGGPDYRAVNVRILLYSEPEMCFWIPRKAFYPGTSSHERSPLGRRGVDPRRLDSS